MSIDKWASDVGDLVTSHLLTSHLLTKGSWHVRVRSASSPSVSGPAAAHDIHAKAHLGYIGVCPDAAAVADERPTHVQSGTQSAAQRLAPNARPAAKEIAVEGPLAPSAAAATSAAACAWQVEPVELTPQMIAWVLASGDRHSLSGVSPTLMGMHTIAAKGL